MVDLSNHYLIYTSDEKGCYGILTQDKMDKYEQERVNHAYIHKLMNEPKTY